MKKRPQWFPFYTGDFLRDTLDLDAQQIGCYILLLCHYYVHGSLPIEANLLRKVGRISKQQWPAIAKALAPKFGPAWTHKRVDQEIEKQEKLSRRRKEYGREGG